MASNRLRCYSEGQTVNGPAPDSVPARSAAVTAATKVENVPAPTAVSTMFFIDKDAVYI